MPASLGTLPTELLRLIIELAVPPESLVFAQAKRRREALVPLSHVSKRFCSVVRPLLRRLVVNTVVDSKSARNAKKELREQAVAMIFCTRQWEKPEFSVAWHERMILAEKEFPAVLGALPSVRYASFVGAAQDSHRTPVSLVLGSNSPYLNLKGLHYQNCTTQVTLVQLALDGVLLHIKAFAELLHPTTLPALRWLRLAGCTSKADILADCAPLLAQLIAFQLDEVTAPSKTRDGISLRKVYTECADKLLVNAWDARGWPSDLVQLSSVPSSRLHAAQRRTETAERVLENARKDPLEDFLQCMARRSIEVVWVDEAEYTFVLPEFVRYLEAKQHA
ncbi:hypothetical protein NBRC10512v2_003212 [Rhodotorula toruloides]